MPLADRADLEMWGQATLRWRALVGECGVHRLQSNNCKILNLLQIGPLYSPQCVPTFDQDSIGPFITSRDRMSEAKKPRVRGLSSGVAICAHCESATPLTVRDRSDVKTGAQIEKGHPSASFLVHY